MAGHDSRQNPVAQNGQTPNQGAANSQQSQPDPQASRAPVRAQVTDSQSMGLVRLPPPYPSAGTPVTNYPDTGYPAIEPQLLAYAAKRREEIENGLRRLPPPPAEAQPEQQGVRRQLPFGGSVVERPDGSFTETHGNVSATVDGQGRVRRVETPKTRVDFDLGPTESSATFTSPNQRDGTGGNQLTLGVQTPQQGPGSFYGEYKTKNAAGYVRHTPGQHVKETRAGVVLPNVQTPLTGGRPANFGVEGGYRENRDTRTREASLGVGLDTERMSIRFGTTVPLDGPDQNQPRVGVQLSTEGFFRRGSTVR